MDDRRKAKSLWQSEGKKGWGQVFVVTMRGQTGRYGESTSECNKRRVNERMKKRWEDWSPPKNDWERHSKQTSWNSPPFFSCCCSLPCFFPPSPWSPSSVICNSDDSSCKTWSVWKWVLVSQPPIFVKMVKPDSNKKIPSEVEIAPRYTLLTLQLLTPFKLSTWLTLP